MKTYLHIKDNIYFNMQKYYIYVLNRITGKQADKYFASTRLDFVNQYYSINISPLPRLKTASEKQNLYREVFTLLKKCHRHDILIK